jgi:anaerobic selenocysteine-containing dehydrogenase
VATRRTKIFIGWNSGKYYHGDLMERAMALLLGLTGNWGKRGTGTRSWAVIGMDGNAFMHRKAGPGQAEAQKLISGMIAMRRLAAANDPTMTAEMIQNRVAEAAGELGGMGNTIPPAFLWYHQFGYKERWNNPGNNDPTMKRSFDEFLREAVDKGWWDPSYAKAYEEVEPRVLFESGGNMLRRQRGGQKLLLQHLWPKLKMIVSCDYRMTTTGLYSDYVLPAAQHYEKLGNSMPSVHHRHPPRREDRAAREGAGDQGVQGPQGQRAQPRESGRRGHAARGGPGRGEALRRGRAGQRDLRRPAQGNDARHAA